MSIKAFMWKVLQIYNACMFVITIPIYLYGLCADGFPIYLYCSDLSVQDTGHDFVTVLSARHAIGHDAAGNLMLVSIDGKSWDHGVSLSQFSDLLISEGMVNGINLDGGGSQQVVVNGTDDDGLYPALSY